MSDVKIWNKKNLIKNNKYRHHPSSYVLRSLVSKNYFNIKNKITMGKILDIGTLYLNNLIPFFDRGFKCYGLETTNESVNLAKKNAKKLKIKCDIKKGFNKKIPFKNNFFDIVLSINTIHYEENIQDIKLSFKEFKRVLKPNGVLLLETVGPNHEFFKNSKQIEKFKFKINQKKDIRHNQVFTFFKSKKVLKQLASKNFKDVEVGSYSENYPRLNLDFWVLKCKK